MKLLAMLAVLCLSTVIHGAGLPEGYLDVTTMGADATGKADSTAAIQSAINKARDEQLAVWFPAGEYLITNRLVADQQPDKDPDNPCVLMGSTVNPQKRATLVLAASSPGFNDPTKRRAMLHFVNIGTPEEESGNTTLYNHAVVGLNFRVMPGNDGAIALRMQGAEGCTIQDVHIDLTQGGHTGIWGVPASGGSTHTVTIVGGKVGIDTRNLGDPENGGGGSQPQPVVSGATLLNQTEFAVRSSTRGSLVLVGCRIERNTPGPVIWLKHHWAGQPFDASLQLVDSVIDYAQPDALNTVIQMDSKHTGRSFVLENCYLRHAQNIWRSDIAGNPQGWLHMQRLAVHVPPPSPNWGKPSEPIYVDGQVHDDVYVQSTSDVAPPVDLTTRHHLPAEFPTWETPGLVNVKTLGARGDGKSDDHTILQQAIDQHEVVFLPKGTFMVSKTLKLRPNTKLIGVYHAFTTIQAISTIKDRFAGATDQTGDQPIVQTADTAQAQTWIGFLHIKRTFPLAQHNPTPVGNYALDWRCGGDSIMRHVELESRPGNNLRPDLIAKHFYKYDLEKNPVDPKHPQKSLQPGHAAWPCNHPNVMVRGNGGGRWFNFWFHGRQGLREDVPFMRVQGTRQPLNFYHMHAQQQDSRNHIEFIDAQNFSVYGTKGEIKGAQVYYEQCRNFRQFGHSGMSSPDPDYFPPYLFRFVDCDDFLIAGISDTVNGGNGKWIGGPYDRWIHAKITTFFPIQDIHKNRPEVIVPSLQRPSLYLRGNPKLP